MSDYDPFVRGPHPVGVVTLDLTDGARDRTLPVELWYPASDAHAGADRDDATKDRYRSLPFAPEVTQDAVRDAERAPGLRPLIVFSHGFGGERRQTTHLCTHWASHGYLVAAMDHVGNTTLDMVQQASQGAAGAEPVETQVARFMADRPADVSFVIDELLAGAGGAAVDAARIGIAGHSFGGWTTLMSVGRDARIRAALPLAPAGGRADDDRLQVGSALGDGLELGWDREVPTLFLLADQDTLLPLSGMRELVARTPEPRRALVLRDADHFHFCDRVEQTHDLFKTMGAMLAGAVDQAPDALKAVYESMKSSAELCPGAHAYALLQGLGLAHMDAHLRDHAAARTLVAGDLPAVMAARGVKVEELR